MYRVSSNLTLFFKIFIPVFWTIFFGLMTIVVLQSKAGELGDFSSPGFKLGMGVFFLIGLLLLWRTLVRLHRVELGQDRFYVSNYFKAARYSYDSIADWEEFRFLIFLIVRIQLHQHGTFGKKIHFIASPGRYKEFINSHPELADQLLDITY